MSAGDPIEIIMAQRPDHAPYTRVRMTRLRTLGARLMAHERLERAARQLDLEATSHADCAGCPICDVRAALAALDRC